MILNNTADNNRAVMNYLNESCVDFNLNNGSRKIAYKSVSEIIKMYFTPNSIGSELFKEIGWNTTKNSIKHKKCKDQSSINALKIKLATKLYLADNGKYPETLTDLFPKYLDKVPVDVFTGEIPEYDYDNKKLKVNIPQENVVEEINNSVYNLNFKK